VRSSRPGCPDSTSATPHVQGQSQAGPGLVWSGLGWAQARAGALRAMPCGPCDYVMLSRYCMWMVV
jgi:hypothetical protein